MSFAAGRASCPQPVHPCPRSLDYRCRVGDERSFIESVNDRLERLLGIRVRRSRTVKEPSPAMPSRPPAYPDDRLLPDPAFLVSSVRSGSTLLRVILNSHSQIHAPHETHFRRLHVQLTTEPVAQAMAMLDLDRHDLEHLLWDRLLHRELTRSGKSVLVEKTPSNAWAVGRFHTAWPDARFVYLLRHPYSIAMSWHEADPQRRPVDRAITHTLGYMNEVERARRGHPGLTVRYEDLTADPAHETERVTDFLGLRWEASMVEYGRSEHGEFRAGVGDWLEKIRTGRVQAGRPLPAPDAVPPALRDICKRWGY